MNLTYQLLYETLAKKYNLNQRNGNYCFTDDNGNVVAIIDFNKIVMYYHVAPEIIWNHKNTVAVAFVKDLNVNGKLCDVISIFGLCGSINDISIIKNFGIVQDCNTAIFSSSYDYEKHEELEQSLKEISDNTSINISRVIFNEMKESFGSCGTLEVKNDKVNLEICNKIYINNLSYSKSSWEGLDINIINIKNKVSTNYDEIYAYYRKENDWYYNAGYDNVDSAQMRQFTEAKKYSTFDKSKIHSNAEIIILANKLTH